MPSFYTNPDGFADVMRQAIARNGSFFNAQRMVYQYAQLAYRLDPAAPPAGVRPGEP
ncbi:hypothetical protein D3C83_334780 [compost metagenome]